MGKVMSYVFTLSMCTQPLGQIIYGRLFDYFSGSVYWVLIPSGLLVWGIGLASIGFFEKLEKGRDSLVVILTSYTQYAIDAIELEVFRYLVKQEMEGCFEIYLNAAIRRIRKEEEKYYFIISPRKKIRISCNDIIYCYKDEKMSVLVTKTGEVRERKTINRLLKDLCAVCDYFMMTERGYFINMYYAEKIQKNMIYLENNIRVPIGVTYMNDVRKGLSDFWRNRL